MLLLLLALSSDDDRAKLAEIEKHYRGLMYAVAFKILKEQMPAEDAVQEALIKILRNINKINEIYCTKTRNWIVYITRTTAINVYKYEKRREHLPDDHFQFYQTDLAQTEEIIVDKEKFDELISAMKKLKYIYSSTLVLRFYFDLSIPQIAEYLNISENNARQRIKRGKKQLQNVYKKDKK